MKQFNKNKQEFLNDELRAFLSADEIEPAPVYFTEKLMERVKQEPAPVKKFRLATVPVIYCSLLTILICIALLFPNHSADVAANSLSWVEKLKSYIPEMPKIEFNIFPSFAISEMLTYIVVGFFGLFVFDLILSKHFFHNIKNIE